MYFKSDVKDCKKHSKTYRQKKKVKKFRKTVNSATERIRSLSTIENESDSASSSTSSSSSCSVSNKQFESDCDSDSSINDTSTNHRIQELCTSNVHDTEETKKLMKWIVETKTPHNHVDKLLKILNNSLLPNLPSCTKTFLNNNITFDIEVMNVPNGNSGEFYHFGMKKKLESIVKSEFHDSNIVELIVNIDKDT